MNKVRPILIKTFKVVLWVVMVLVIIFEIIAALIQVPGVQKKIVNYATSFVSCKTHTKVEIKNIRISFPKSVVIEGIYLEDPKKDTLLYTGKAKVNIALFDLFKNKIAVNSASLEDVNLRLNNTKTDSLFNYNFLLAAFSDTANQKKAEPQSESKWTFGINNVNLKNIRLIYDDEYGGMNLAAVLGKSELEIDKIDPGKSFYGINEIFIENLNAKVQLTKHTNADKKKSVGVLPKITANKIQIKNSTLTYGDSISKQSILIALNQFELKAGSVDLQKEIVSLQNLNLSKSKIQFNTTDTNLSPENKVELPNATTGSNWKVTVKSIGFDDNSFSYQVENKPELKNIFDANHLTYNHLNLYATDLFYSSDASEVSVKKFSAIDQNNFAVTRFETDFSMDQHSMTAKKLIIKTTNSSIVADVNIQYSSLKSLKDSIPNLFLNSDIQNVSIKNSDILYFNPQLISQAFFKNMTNITTISGIVNGKVNNLKGKNLIIKTGVGTVLKTDFSITGLPDVETAYFDFPDLEINTDKQDIEMMTGASFPKTIQLPEKTVIQIIFKGNKKSFESTVGLNSSFGTVHLFATIDKNENFRSKINLTSFDFGRLLKDTVIYGPVTLTAEANGRGLDKNNITANIKADASQIYLNKYIYHNLSLEGKIDRQEYEGKLNLNDDNAAVDLDGLINLNPNQELYKFRLNVKAADLQKLNFTRDDIRIGFVASADFKGSSVNKLNGRAEISNMIIAKNEKKYTIDSLLTASINEPYQNEKKLNSLIGLKYSGPVSPAALSTELISFLNNYFPFSEGNQIKETNGPSKFNFEIYLHNHPILTQVLPQLQEFEPGNILGSFDSEKNDLKLSLTIGKIVYGTTEIKDFVINVNSNQVALNYKISGANISNSQISLDNFILDGKLADKTIFANVSSIAANQNKKIVIHSQITKDKGNYKLAIDPKDFYLINNRWDISEDNYIEFGKEGILIHHFFINNTVSQLNIASVNDKFQDDLNITIKNFRLDDISEIIIKDSTLIKGSLNGNVLLKRVNDKYGIIADTKINNLAVRNIPIGNISFKADNPAAGKFDIDVNLSGNENNMTAKGFFVPNGGDNSINIETAIQSISMKTIEAFSMGQIKEASGKLSGNLLIQGAITAPEVTGELVFNDAFIKPALLNNRLELKHEIIQLKKGEIYFNSFTLSDADKHTAIIDGTVQVKQFKDFIFALNVNTTDFLLFNSTARDNKEFYGRMIIDSRIDINGPMTHLAVNGKLKMKKGSKFTFAVPEDKLTTDKGEDVVEFEFPKELNPILSKAGNKAVQKSGFKGFDLSSIIEIDKQATLRLLMDPASTDSLVVKGEAALSYVIDRSGKMSLTGAYNLDEGSYFVSLESVIKKKFNIISGSTITWNGDPLDAEISINANYSVHTEPYNLVADQISGLSDAEKGSYKQRCSFLVLLKLRGEILHPVISFEIQLAPQDKGILGGSVNQKLNMLNENESELNKQVFALLILGRFVQENPLQNQSGGTATMVRSTVGNFLSAQLNKWSSKVMPGTELNFDIQSYDDYQTGKAQGRTQVGIGIKKQLFNERLSVQIGGNIDVEGEKVKQNSANNITSDLTVEYKLTEDGRYKLKGFRHNQYEDVIEGQIVETGAGILYVHDFNKWKDFFKGSKKKMNDTINSR